MKIKLKEGCLEYQNGCESHYKKADEPFDMDAREAERLLKTGLFEIAPKVEPKVEAKETKTVKEKK